MKQSAVIWMFSGQGSQYFQMGRELYQQDRGFRDWMDQQDRMLRDFGGESVTALLYRDRKIGDPFSETRNTHPAIFMVQYALARVLLDCGLRPDCVLGASLGEFVAAAVAGVMSHEDALYAVCRQADLLEQKCPRGGMVAVLDAPAIWQEREQLKGLGHVAAVNFDNHFVLAGSDEAIVRIGRYLGEQSILHQVLSVSRAFHSPLIDSAADDYLSFLAKKRFGSPTIPFVSAARAAVVHTIDSRYFWDVIRKPISFQQTIRSLEDAGGHVYVDLGPSGTLAGFVRKNLGPDSRSTCFPVMTLFGRDLHNLGVLKEHFRGRGIEARSGVARPQAGANDGRSVPREPKTPTAYLFPGQGSQAKGMGAGLFEQFPDMVSRADSVLGYSVRELCLEDPGERLNKTQYTQPALYVVNALMYRKRVGETGTEPDFLAGHSLGEYSALYAAGAYDFETGLRLVAKRGEIMSRASGGGMAAVIGASRHDIEQLLARSNLATIDIANLNAPGQIVISGMAKDIELAGEIFRAKNIMIIPLNVSGAFHSRYMKDASIEYEEFLRPAVFSDLRIPVISNVTARPHEMPDIKKNIVNQITASVQWTESVRYLLNQGPINFEEIGPGNVLTRLVAKIRQEVRPAGSAPALVQ